MRGEAAYGADAGSTGVRWAFSDGEGNVRVAEAVTRGPVVATLRADECLFRVIELPRLGAREVVASIRWELQRILPFPVEEGVFDFAPLPESGGGRAVAENAEGMELPRQRYAVSGSRLEVVDQRLAALEHLGIRPAALEPEWVTLWRLALDFQAEGLACGVVDLGESGSRLMVVDPSGVPFAFHRLQVGGRALTQALASAIGAPPEEAERLKTTEFAHDLGPLAASTALSELATDLARALRRVQQELRSVPVEIWAAGGGALWPALRAVLSEALSLEMQVPGTPEAVERSPVGALDPRWALAGELARWYVARRAGLRRGLAAQGSRGEGGTAPKGGSPNR